MNMEVKEIFQILKNEIHSTVFATVDENGLPQTCVIDIMLCDDSSLYFITAKGKSFYDRLMLRKYVAISGMKGHDTLSTVAISVRGKIRNIGNTLLSRVLAENPYMTDIYKTEDSRMALEVFQLYEGEGEYFDLSCLPPKREAFTFGGKQLIKTGYEITEKCVGCSECVKKCPIGCIVPVSSKFAICLENCIHCGNCFAVCGFGAVEKR